MEAICTTKGNNAYMLQGWSQLTRSQQCERKSETEISASIIGSGIAEMDVSSADC